MLVTKKRSFPTRAVDSGGHEEDKMLVNDQEDVHEDAVARPRRPRRTCTDLSTTCTDTSTTIEQAAAAASVAVASVVSAESSRAPSPVADSKQTIVKETPSLSAVSDSSISSPPSSTAVMPAGDKVSGKLDVSWRQQQSRALEVAKAILTREVDEDIDRISAMRQQECCHYGSCYDYLSDTHDQASSGNPNEHINEGWRRSICSWSFEIVDHYRFDREVVSIALNYLDRVMANKTKKAGVLVTRKEFQLSAVTALYLAIKLHGETDAKDGGPRMLSINAFVELGRGLFSIATIETMERSFLATLEWRVNPPTAVSFIASLLRLLPKKFKRLKSGANAIFEKARYLTELSVCVSTFSFQFKASEVAFAAILCSVYALRESVPFSQEVRGAFLASVAGATSLSPSTASVQRACTMLREVCPSVSDRPDDVLSGLSRSTSIHDASEKVTPKAGKKIPVSAEVHVEEFIPRKRSRTKT
jgi:hypothetical protein